LFVLDENGEPVIVDAKAHGLGHLLPPDGRQETDSDGDDDETKLKPWMRELWLMLVRETLGLPVNEPEWLDLPAMSWITVSQPATLKLVAQRNDGKEYGRSDKTVQLPHSATYLPIRASRG
jgi:hypothetical protein